MVYALTCPCKKISVGRTIRPLRERFNKHRVTVEKGLAKYRVAQHFLNKHGKDSSLLGFLGYFGCQKHLTEGDRFKKLLETYVIFKINGLTPECLNQELDLTILI